MNTYLPIVASRVSVGVSVLLILLKTYAVYVTDSLSLLSSLFDSGMDAVASIGNLIAVTFAVKPASLTYRFGYGKLEAVSALLQSFLIVLSMGFLLFEACKRIITPEPLKELSLGIGVMIISVILTIGLVLFQRYTLKRAQSLAVKADSLHYKTDLAVNLIVMASLWLSSYFPFFDSIGCAAIGIFVLISTKEIFRESLWVLLDREIPKKDQLAIMNIIQNFPGVRGFHNFRSRSSGQKLFIDLHIELSPAITLLEAHALSHAVKKAVEKEYPNADLIVHQDPYNDEDGSF
jgi:ferrous-iron efflux pump FieF